MTEIQGFRILPLKCFESSSAYHELYVKEHNVRYHFVETPLGYTLFVLNVPPYATEESFAEVFSAAGSVKSVIFRKQPNDANPNIIGFKIAYVVFNNPESVKKTLTLKQLKPLFLEDTESLGLKKWTRNYNSGIVDPKALQDEINKFMGSYDTKVEEEKEREKAGGEADDEGWVTVSKHRRKPGLARKEALELKIKGRIEKSKKKKELQNFYTFQIRQSKMKHLASLRQKYEEDKRKIESLKQARKFRPL